MSTISPWEVVQWEKQEYDERKRAASQWVQKKRVRISRNENNNEQAASSIEADTVSESASCVGVRTSFSISVLFTGLHFPRGHAWASERLVPRDDDSGSSIVARVIYCRQTLGGRNHLFRHQIRAEDTHTQTHIPHIIGTRKMLPKHWFWFTGVPGPLPQRCKNMHCFLSSLFCILSWNLNNNYLWHFVYNPSLNHIN